MYSGTSVAEYLGWDEPAGGASQRVLTALSVLDDDRMLHFMSRENAEEFGHDFYNTVVQSVRSVVLAYGAGLVELEKVVVRSAPGTNHSGVQAEYVRVAPSFRMGVDKGTLADRLYTATTVGSYLGWMVASPYKKSGLQPTDRVLTALSVLELLEEGSLKPRAIMGLDHGAVREVVVAAKQAAERAVERREGSAPETLPQVSEVALMSTHPVENPRAESRGGETRGATSRSRDDTPSPRSPGSCAPR